MTNDRLVLAIDTSFGPVSAAVADERGVILAHFIADNPPGTQAETLPPRIAELFASATLRFVQLSRVAVTVGPGAFTGVRVGLAFAKGLRLATGAEVLGFSTLECLAAQAIAADKAATVASVIDARRGEVYLQVFDASLEPVFDAALFSVLDAQSVLRKTLLSPALITGSGAPLVAVSKEGARVVTIDRIDTRLLARRAVSADFLRHPARAAYLRAPDARLPS